MNAVCFTGHRKIDCPDMYALKTLLDSTICGLVKRGVTDFYCGGALGFDTMCAHMILYLKKRKALGIKLHLVLPCSNEEQTKNWSYNDKQEFYAILMAADASYTAEEVLSDPNLQSLRAVESGRVYKLPNAIESWDSPVPASFLGSFYLASVLHPDRFSEQAYAEAVRAFYLEFYGFEPEL